MIARVALLSLIATSASGADIPARLDWSQRVEISASVPGVVDSVEVSPGQTVARGATLLSLNPTLYKASLMEARADIERLTEEATDAKRELDRAQELYSRTVSSTTELDAAKLRHARANALLTAAEARVEKARRLLDESAPKAPFDALVLDRVAEPGMAVTAQCQPTVLLTLARADRLIARATLDADTANGIQIGNKVTVNVGGKTLEGPITALHALPEGRYRLDAAIPRAPGLQAGMSASIRLQ